MIFDRINLRKSDEAQLDIKRYEQNTHKMIMTLFI